MISQNVAKGTAIDTNSQIKCKNGVNKAGAERVPAFIHEFHVANIFCNEVSE